MADILASVSVVLGAEISGFKAAMANARRELSGLVKFSEGLQGVGEGLTKFVTLPTLAVGGAAVKMAGDMEKAQASFKTMLGSAAAATATLTDLKDFAADTPFEFPEIQQAAKKLLAFNTPAAELKETLRELGDVSSGIDAPIGEIAELFGKARVQGRLFQEDINQLTGRGIPIIQELAKQFGVSEAGVRKLVESGRVNFGNLQRAFADLTAEGGKFGGLMEEQSQTLPGLFSTLSDTVGQALADLGADLVQGFDLKGVLRELAGDVQGAADAFRTLSPEAKSFIISLVGVAAATGPVLVAVGTLGAALPAIRAGFVALSSGVQLAGAGLAALANPATLAVAAVAALGVGLYYLATESERAHAALLQQVEATNRLTTEVSPLLDRYEELKRKTQLNAAEQEELRKIIEQVTKIMPEAGSKIDSYGTFIDIAADKARKFVESNQALTKALALKDLPAQQAKLASLEKQYASLTRQADEFSRTGKIKLSADDKTGYTADQLGTRFIVELQENLNKVNAAVQAQRLELEKTQVAAGLLDTSLRDAVVGGGDLAAALGEVAAKTGLLVDLETRLKTAREARPALLTEKDIAASNALVASLEQQIKRLNDLGNAERTVAESFRSIGRESQALGDQFNYLQARQAADQQAIQTLLDAGYSPFSAKVKELASDLRNLNVTLGDNENLSLRVAKGLENVGKPQDFELKLPTAIKPPEVLPLNLTGLDLSAEGLGAAYDAMLLKQRSFGGSFTQAQADFNTNTEALLAAFPAQAFGNIGAAIGSALGEGTDVLEAAGKAILGSLANLGAQFGAYLVTLGVANLTVPGAQGLGIAQIAAGGALVIAAGALGAFASSGGTKSAGGGGKGISTSPASQPRTFNPTTAPAAASAPATYKHTVVITADGRALSGALQLELDRMGRVLGSR
jgi:tape measure domain-containing protein